MGMTSRMCRSHPIRWVRVWVRRFDRKSVHDTPFDAVIAATHEHQSNAINNDEGTKKQQCHNKQTLSQVWLILPFFDAKGWLVHHRWWGRHNAGSVNNHSIGHTATVTVAAVFAVRVRL